MTNKNNNTTVQYRFINKRCSENRKNNPLWKYFSIVQKEIATNDDESKSQRLICLLCHEKNIVHVYMKSTSSGNLWLHLNRKHDIPLPDGKFHRHRKNSDSLNINPENYDNSNDTDSDNYSDHRYKHNSEQQENNFDSNDSEVSYTKQDDVKSLIIDAVEKRPELYIRSLNASNKTKEEHWQKVYEEIGKIIEINEIKKLWESIYNQYKRLRILRESGAAGSIQYKYYDQLAFLNQDIDDEKLSLNNTTYKDDESYNCLSFEEIDIITEIEEPEGKKAKTVVRDERYQSQREDDEFDLFGKFIAEKLRTHSLKSPRNSETLQLKIMQLLTRK